MVNNIDIYCLIDKEKSSSIDCYDVMKAAGAMVVEAEVVVVDVIVEIVSLS